VRLDGDNASEMAAPVATEVPVAFVYGGRTYVVMMCTPADLEDLAVGFSVTEGIVRAASDVRRVEVVRHSRGVELQIDIPAGDAERLSSRGRAISGRTGCGLCGVDAIEDVLRVPAKIDVNLAVDAEALWRAAAALDERQPWNLATHAIHAAAWAEPSGALRVVREDVGRHNALDKVLGALARAGIDASAGFLVVTSRASYELVLKAAASRVALLAAVSRPTSLAIRLADDVGLTLVGLLRGRSANVYAHPERVSSRTATGRVGILRP
jgi:FdhD protein